MQPIFWLIIAVAMFVGEIACPIFFMFWFGIGALGALVTSIITSNLVIQIVVFLCISILLTLFAKPLTSKFFKNKEKDELNVNGMAGKVALVTKTINNLEGVGEAKIGGEVWSAISENESEVIEVGTQVTVVRVDGVKIIVKK